MPLRYLFFSIFFLMCSNDFIQAQETISVDTIRLPIETLTINDGLSQGFVRAIAQDHDGFMWFGTKDGLNRYDGYRFTVFRNDPLDQHSIPENFVTCLFIDSRGLLWTGFLSGTLGVFNPKTGKFFSMPSVKLNVHTGNEYVSSFSEDNNGNIWTIYSSNDIIEVLCSGLTPETIISSPEKIRSIIVSDVLEQQYHISKGSGSIAFDKSGKIWKSVRDSVFVWDDKLSPLFRLSIKNLAQLPSANSSSFCIDKKNDRLFMVTESGVSVVDPRTQKVITSCYKHIKNRGEFNPFNFDAEHNCWFLADEICFLQINQQQLHVVLSDKPGLFVTVLFIDRSGIVWLGTNGTGIFKLNPRSAGFHHLVPPNSFKSVNKLTALSDGSVIVNTVSPFLLKNEDGREIIHSILPPSLVNVTPVNEIARDTDGSYWCALGYNDLYNYNPQTGVVRQFLKNRTAPPLILGIMFDRAHEMWIGKVENGTARFLHFEPVLNSITDSIEFPIKNVSVGSFIGQVYDDGESFWFATSGGLFRYDHREKLWSHFIADPKDTATLSSNSLLCICPDEKEPGKILWIGSEGGGLNRFDVSTGKVNRIGAKQGLPNQVVYGILTDSSANLWMSTNKGIACYNPVTKTFRSYVQSDGLQSNEFNRFAFCKTPDGELYFGGLNGLNHFFPSEIKSNSLPPLINFTSVRIFNKDLPDGNMPVEPGANLQLTYSQNMITIEFAAMDYTVPSKNQYRYRLEGFNHEWISNGTKNDVTFTNLNPGHYTFIVKAANSSGVWNEGGKSFSFTVLPPWYMTWWFRISVVVAVLAIGYAVYRYRINQLLKMQSVRNRIAGDLHDEIGSTLSSISIYSKVVQNRTKEKVPEAEPYLNRINNDIAAMMEAMSDIVWTINSSNDRFENIYSRMRSTSAELLEAKNYMLHFEFDETMNHLKLNMEQRKNFYLIFKEALNNIAKYADGKNVWIKLSKQHSKIGMLIRDDGRGFNTSSGEERPETKRGNGMATMRARAQKLNGTLEINSGENSGTTVELLFPIA